MTNKLLSFVVFLSGIICAAQTQSPNKVSQEVYSNPEIKAEFPGGFKQFYSFIMEELVVPDIKEEVDLKVYFSFIITAEGKLEDINVLRDPGHGVATELVRVVKLSPVWKPASHHGLAVASKMTLPLTLSLKPTEEVDLPKKEDLAEKPAEIKKPLYPGGDEKFHEDFFRNFNMPESTVRLNEKVQVSFVVEIDGSVSNVLCTHDPGYGLGNEAIKAIKLLKRKWIPANIDGKPVRLTVIHNISVTVEAGSGVKVKKKKNIVRDTGPKHNFYDQNLQPASMKRY